MADIEKIERKRVPEIKRIEQFLGKHVETYEHEPFRLTPRSGRLLLDELSRLREVERRAVEVMQPFAEIADWYDARESDDFEIWRDYPEGLPRNLSKLKHFRAARALSERKEGRADG